MNGIRLHEYLFHQSQRDRSAQQRELLQLLQRRYACEIVSQTEKYELGDGFPALQRGGRMPMELLLGM